MSANPPKGVHWLPALASQPPAVWPSSWLPSCPASLQFAPPTSPPLRAFHAEIEAFLSAEGDPAGEEAEEEEGDWQSPATVFLEGSASAPRAAPPLRGPSLTQARPAVDPVARRKPAYVSGGG